MPTGLTFGRYLAVATAALVWLVANPWTDHVRAAGIEFLPGTSPFRPLLADPREANHSLRYVVGSGRAGGEASFGDTFGLVRFSNDQRVQVGLQASVFTRFNRDIDSAGFLDINSSDYTIFIPVDLQFGRVAVRTGFGHTSSHLGEIEAQRRILNGEAMFYDPSFLYRRDYVRVVSAWDATDRLRIYGGASVAVHLTPEGGRTAAQVGAEWTGPPQALGTLARQWFAGVDVQTWAESDWAVNANVEGGLRVSRPDAERGIRLAVSAYAGRSLQRVLASEREQYISVGLVFEF
jgi:hypothetical protein